MMENASLSVVGASLDLPSEVVKVDNGWNWIGYNSSSILSLNQALAGLNPENGDLIKGQSGFAYFEGYEWVLVSALFTVVIVFGSYGLGYEASSFIYGNF